MSSTATQTPKQMRAAQILEQGGLDVIQVREGVDVPTPGAGEVLIRVEYAGVNFIDTCVPFARRALWMGGTRRADC